MSTSAGYRDSLPNCSWFFFSFLSFASAEDSGQDCVPQKGLFNSLHFFKNGSLFKHISLAPVSSSLKALDLLQELPKIFKNP